MLKLKKIIKVKDLINILNTKENIYQVLDDTTYTYKCSEVIRWSLYLLIDGVMEGRWYSEK